MDYLPTNRTSMTSRSTMTTRTMQDNRQKNPYEVKDGQPIPYGYFGEKYRGGDPIYGKDPSRRPPNQEFDQLGMERTKNRKMEGDSKTTVDEAQDTAIKSLPGEANELQQKFTEYQEKFKTVEQQA